MVSIVLCIALFRRSLNLIETLLDLAEKGHYAEVMALFKVPMKQCPEVLFLGLLQCKVRCSSLVIHDHCKATYAVLAKCSVWWMRFNSACEL